MDLHLLPALAVLSDNVTIVEKDGVKIIRVIHEKATAGISLHGGHVVSFKPNDQADLIWMSKSAIFDGKAAFRGGIPICWPWFGRIAAPAHGFARTSQWEILEHKENDHGVIVSLGLNPSEQTLALWPHQFAARLNIEISSQLTVTLEVTNTDTTPWSFSGALHTYLNIANIADVETTGMGSAYLDNLQSGKACNGEETLTINQVVDRVYTQPAATVEVKDKQLNRTLQITNAGHNSAVIWNPWAEGAEAMADMDNNGYQTMLCVESALHAPCIESGKTLQPGESHQLITVLSAK
ncbi:D-hexose-6-phosphate mutarotase [Vibrio sp. 10N.286.49.B3]|uniref:D-hexose-6-phosphate mutarotase n=1 Tax=Vibrio sp. 10N.286.49.B3 TaxID=1880855 RepID=UPI000C856D38|nr:D-hexose-6-phosphate mutarotase [Vibrio sp. 10N.286.49.B3]PMH40588.1 D-hexose-6-phosphate mutarotase [Vibrio sp. 10N.286.49.B3]